MGILIADKFKTWEQAAQERFNQLKTKEEELNRIFIDIYGLQDELTPKVDKKARKRALKSKAAKERVVALIILKKAGNYVKLEAL